MPTYDIKASESYVFLRFYVIMKKVDTTEQSFNISFKNEEIFIVS